MSIINLTDATKNFEEIKLSPQKNFKIKSIFTTDHYNLFDETITDSNSIIALHYPSDHFTSYGLTPLYSYKTNVLKEIGNGGNSQLAIPNATSNRSINNNVFSSINLSSLSKIRPDIELDSNVYGVKSEFDSNYFGIKRLHQELKPFSRTLNKKRIIRNLYNSYHCLKDAKFSQQFHYGFYNYNCFNFFNILPGEKISAEYKNNFKNKSHKNALIYTNTDLASNNLSANPKIKLGINKDLTINFWINPKRMAMIGKRYNPGCILHLPNIISIYLIPDDTVTNVNNQTIEFKILCNLGKFANILPNNPNISESFSYNLISNDNLSLNTWYNISIIINNYDVKLYVDNNLTHWQNNINNTNISNLEFEKSAATILTIGNRLNNENESLWINNSEKLKNYFFNKESFKEQHLNVTEINQNSDDSVLANQVNWNIEIFDLNLNQNDFNHALQSQALNAEIYGLMIFNNEINFNQLFNYAYGAESVVNNVFLSFYLPCTYISDLIKRKGYITLGARDDIAYRSVVNPYFAHKIYGHELSIESFSLDIVNLRKPYILGMNGKEYIDAFSTSIDYDDIVLNDKINLIKDYFVNHDTPNQSLNKIMNSNISLFDNNFINQNFQFDNIVYRNNFILPCDNGKTKFNISEIFKLQKIKDLIGNSLNTFYHQKNPHFVKLESLYHSNNEYSGNNFLFLYTTSNDIIYNRIYTDSFVTLAEIPNKPTKDSYLTQTFFDENSLCNIQLIAYNTMTSQNMNRELMQSFFTKLKAFTDNKYLLSNSIFKNIDSNYNASLNPPENIVWTSKVFDENNVISYSKYFNSHYSIEGDLAETHSVLFEISNVLYSSKIRQKFIEINDIDLSGSGGALNITIKDNGQGLMYRADCNGEHATWAHIGHAFYSDGFVNVLHPGLSNFGENNFNFNLKGKHSLYIMQVDIPVERGECNVSQNKSYIKGLKPSSNLSDLEETDFVYLTGVNLHDENLNIVAKAKFSQPIVKRLNDRYNIRLKMDF